MAEFAAALRALLSELGQESEIEAGSWLWKEGDPGEDVVLVKKGVLQVVHEGPEGELMVLRDLEPGSVLGEIACLDRQLRSASVRASTACRIARVPAAQFRKLVGRRPQILEALLLQQVQIVRSLTGQVSRTHRRGDHRHTDPTLQLRLLQRALGAGTRARTRDQRPRFRRAF